MWKQRNSLFVKHPASAMFLHNWSNQHLSFIIRGKILITLLVRPILSVVLFQCQLSATGDGIYYCCSGSSLSAYCGDGTPNLINNQPQQCFPTLANTCPINYVCEI